MNNRMLGTREENNTLEIRTRLRQWERRCSQTESAMD